MKENDIVAAFGRSLKNDAISSSADLLEVGLDMLIDDGVLKEIPFISTTIGAYKIGKSIREIFHIKKLAVFIQEINKGIVSEEQRNDYIQKIENDPSKMKNELEYILILLDRFVEIDKAKMLSKLYLAYLNNKISWVVFSQYANIIDRLLEEDFKLLDSCSDMERWRERYNITDLAASFLRLSALGLMEPFQDVSKYTKSVELAQKRHLAAPSSEIRAASSYQLTLSGHVLNSILFGKDEDSENDGNNKHSADS